MRYCSLASHSRPSGHNNASAPRSHRALNRPPQRPHRYSLRHVQHCPLRPASPRSVDSTRVCRKASLRGFEPFSIPRPPPATSAYPDRPICTRGMLDSCSHFLPCCTACTGTWAPPAAHARPPTNLNRALSATTSPGLHKPLDADRTAAGTDTPASTRSFVPTHPREVLPCSSHPPTPGR